MNVDEALAQCRLSTKNAAAICEKLIQGAAANATHNLGLSREDLFVGKYSLPCFRIFLVPSKSQTLISLYQQKFL